jgi:hypothetical protein
MNPENIEGDTDIPELAAEGDIQIDTPVIDRLSSPNVGVVTKNYL